ncbi:MAG: fatty acid--CoA ligase family protein [Acidimicrobiia bacterium]
MKQPELDYQPTMPVVVRRAAELFGDRPYIVTDEETTTFVDLERRSRQLAKRLLAVGVGKGTRVGMHVPVGNDWVVAWAAAARIGALVMPFSTLYAPGELGRALRMGDIHLLLAPSVMFGRDHAEFLERSIPGLASSEAGSLFLPKVPYLRSVMLLGDRTRAWATPADGESSEPLVRVSDDLLGAVEDEVVPADEMVVIFTSGSTSEPKAVVHTQGAVFRKTSLPTPGIPPPGGCVFVGQPFFWVGGLQNLGSAIQSGATIVCQPRPDPAAALALIERTRATMVIAWANTTQRLRADPSFATRDLSAIPQLTMPAGDPELRHNSLGMTETVGPHTGFARPGASPEELATPLPERLRGSWGAPLPFIGHKIVDPVSGDDLADGEEGEICVRGYCLMTRIYKRERHEVFDRDGWYHTGDRGFFRDGYLFFTGRLTEMIKTHGANVSPREVELVLEAQPDVAQAFVMGVPDADRGEQVAAAIVPAGPAALDVDDLRRRLAAELSSYKVPRQFVLLRDEEVPWLASGKPDRLSIRDILTRASDAS